MPLDPIAGQAAADVATHATRAEFDRQNFTLRRTVQELKAIAFSDISKYVQIGDDGALQMINLDAMPRSASRAVKKVREKTRITEKPDGSQIWKESTVEYELYDKLAALKLGLEMRGDKPAERHEVTGKDGGPILTKAVYLTDDELLDIARRSSDGASEEKTGA